MIWGKPVPARLGLLTLLVLSVFAWAPATFPGYWQSLAGFVPIFNAVQVRPLASVATAPDFWRGTGSAAFFLVQPMLWLGATPTLAVRGTFILAFLLGGIGIYLWLRPLLGDRSAGLAGLIYVLMPTFLATVYVRGSLADALILAWLPLAFAGLTLWSGERSLIGAAAAVVSIVWLWRTQAGLALLASLLLLIYALTLARPLMNVLIVLVSAGAGALSLFPQWFTAAPAPVTFTDHFVYLHQLFAVTWQTAPSVPGWQDYFPFQLGWAALAFSAVSLWTWWAVARRSVTPAQRRLLAFAAIGAGALVLLVLPASAPLWAGTHADRLLTYPWQLLVLAAPLLAVTAGALPALLSSLATPVYWAALAAAVVLASYPYLTAEFTTVEPPRQPVAVLGNNQLAILAAELAEGGSPRTAQLTVTWQALQPLEFDDNVFFQAIASPSAAAQPGGEQVVAQLDQQPLGGQHPATAWQPGSVYTETYTLDLSRAPAGDALRYYFGYYNWQNGRRLPVDGGLDDKLVLHGN